LSVEKIIFFDGVCNLCNGAVNFVIDHDPEAKFKFAALQSDVAKKKLPQERVQHVDSIVLLKQGKTFIKSEAALLIAKELKFPWSMFQVFLIIPKFFRDPLYNFIAKRRYKWFGKKDACRIPTPELQDRFVTD
jgi:predicted DCC family thiol-disulfide oxidoreductase YuxK